MKQLILIMLSILLVGCCNKHNTKHDNNSLIADMQEEQNSINLSDTISIEEYKVYKDSIYILSIKLPIWYLR